MIARWKAWRYERAMKVAGRTIRRRLKLMQEIEHHPVPTEEYERAYQRALEKAQREHDGLD